MGMASPSSAKPLRFADGFQPVGLESRSQETWMVAQVERLRYAEPVLYPVLDCVFLNA
jgi:hypothetical protein